MNLYPSIPALPPWALPATVTAVAAVLVAVTAFAVGRRGRRATAAVPRGDHPGGTRLETGLTLAAAGIATGVAVNGMWNVFGDVLHLDGLGRVALAGFLEIALMVSAIRARRALRESGSVGVDGAAVWVMALLSAVLAAADAQGLARAVRFAAPLVAAWLWERGLAAERRRVRDAAGGAHRSRIAWRITPDRIAVRIGLADPTTRGVDAIDRSRRLARLTRARVRLAVLERSTLPRWLAVVTGQQLRLAAAAWRLQRYALAAVEHLHLGIDQSAADAIRTTVAAVTGLRAATDPEALTDASPWRAGAPVAAVPAVPVVYPSAPALDRAPGYTSAGAVPAYSRTRPAVPEYAPAPGYSGGGEPVAATGTHPEPAGAPAGAPAGLYLVGGSTAPGYSTPAAQGAEYAYGCTPGTHPYPAAGAAVRTREVRSPDSGAEDQDDGPDPVPESTDSDEEIVEAIAATGEVPSLRAIKSAFRVGQVRARRIQVQATARLTPTA